jgi:toxin ParE1/3/4
MPDVLVTPAAENDLLNIWLYIAQENGDAANRVYWAAEKTFETLVATPRIGMLYHTKRVQLKDVRFLLISSFQNYIIYYQEYLEGIKIIRVLHAHMQRVQHLESEN